MDQDDKIRQYVLKKQQQRERAQHLRTQRRTERPPAPNPNKNHGPPSSFNSRPASFASKNRIIGDPFAPSNNNENINRNNGSVYNEAPPYDNHSHYDNNNNNNPPPNKYGRNTYHGNNSNNPNDYNPRTEDRYSNNTPFGGDPPRNNTNSNSNEDYNDYNPNFNRNAPNNNSNKWQTTPMSKPNRETRDNRAFTNQSKYSNGNNNYRGFNRNNNDRNPSNVANHGAFARNRNRPTDRNAMQYSPSMDAKDEPSHSRTHSRAESNEMVNSNNNKKSLQYATAADVKKIVSMVEQLRGQMHALQFQIDNVKTENTKLKEKIIDLENKAPSFRAPNNNQNHDNTARPRNDGFNSNNTHFNANNGNNEYWNARNKSSKMDIDNDHMPLHGTNNQNRRRNAPSANGNNGFNTNGDTFNNNPHRSDAQIKFNFNANGNSNTFNKSEDNFNNNGFNSNFNRSMPNRMNMDPRAGAQLQDNGDHDRENEIAAPPKSSAADLIAKLEQTQGAYVEEQNVERVECRQCGRKFGRAALERHIRICKKVFGQKRKAFNMKQQRADDEALKAQRNTNTAEIEAEIKRKKEAHKAKWKAQSSMLRQAIKQSKQIETALKNGKSLADIPNIPSQIPDDRVPCPHCGRKFAEETAKRHIPKCQNIKSRPKALKRRR